MAPLLLKLLEARPAGDAANSKPPRGLPVVIGNPSPPVATMVAWANSRVALPLMMLASLAQNRPFPSFLLLQSLLLLLLLLLMLW